MVARKDVEQIRRDAAEAFSNHTCNEAISRSFVFRREDRRSAYWFRLTWTPGALALTGDLGELTLVHGHALARFDDIGWALSPDHNYLMSKTDLRQEYSPDETFAYMVQYLNEEALEALNGRRWRSFNRSEASEGSWQRHASPGYRQELQAWRREVAAARAAGEPEDELPERPDNGAYVFTRRHDWEHRALYSGRSLKPGDLWHIPDHWERWVRACHALHDATEHPDVVLLARNRAKLKREMRDTFGDQTGAGELLHRMEFDDYYGSYVWPAQSYWQIAAIQHGVRMILAGTASESAAPTFASEAA